MCQVLCQMVYVSLFKSRFCCCCPFFAHKKNLWLKWFIAVIIVVVVVVVVITSQNLSGRARVHPRSVQSPHLWHLDGPSSGEKAVLFIVKLQRNRFREFPSLPVGWVIHSSRPTGASSTWEAALPSAESTPLHEEGGLYPAFSSTAGPGAPRRQRLASAHLYSQHLEQHLVHSWHSLSICWINSISAW